MSSQDGERSEAQTIPFPEGETKAKQQSRPGENQADPARCPVLETGEMAKPVTHQTGWCWRPLATSCSLPDSVGEIAVTSCLRMPPPDTPTHNSIPFWSGTHIGRAQDRQEDLWPGSSQTRRHWPYSAGPQEMLQSNFQEFSDQTDKETQGGQVSRGLQRKGPWDGASAQLGDRGGIQEGRCLSAS